MLWTVFLLCLSARLPAQMAPVFDVTRFGAAADNTDSTDAVQAAINAAARAGGGRVVFPPAVDPYRISRSLRIAANSIALAGEGATLRLADKASIRDQDAVILAEGSPDRPLRDVLIEGLTLDANFFAQDQGIRPRGIEFRFVERARVTDVIITRAYVGLDFGRGCADGEARRVTITDYAEDAFDAGGDAEEYPGGVARDIRFVDVTARDAPRAKADGNAFEIEDGAQDVLVERALVENVAGMGFGLRNHRAPGRHIHSRNVTLRDVTIRSIGGALAGFARCAPAEDAARDSFHEIHIERLNTRRPVAFSGPMRGLRLTGGRYGELHLGFENAGQPAIAATALADARVENIRAARIRVNAAAGIIVLSGAVSEQGFIEIEGKGGDVRVSDGRTSMPATR